MDQIQKVNNFCDNKKQFQDQIDNSGKATLKVDSDSFKLRCRCCVLNRGKINVFNVYYQDLLIKEILEKCMLTKIKTGDGLPECICDTCTTTLVSLHKFIKKYDEVQELLAEMKNFLYKPHTKTIKKSSEESTTDANATVQFFEQSETTSNPKSSLRTLPIHSTSNCNFCSSPKFGTSDSDISCELISSSKTETSKHSTIINGDINLSLPHGDRKSSKSQKLSGVSSETLNRLIDEAEMISISNQTFGRKSVSSEISGTQENQKSYDSIENLDGYFEEENYTKEVDTNVYQNKKLGALRSVTFHQKCSKLNVMTDSRSSSSMPGTNKNSTGKVVREVKSEEGYCSPKAEIPNSIFRKKVKSCSGINKSRGLPPPPHSSPVDTEVLFKVPKRKVKFRKREKKQPRKNKSCVQKASNEKVGKTDELCCKCIKLFEFEKKTIRTDKTTHIYLPRFKNRSKNILNSSGVINRLENMGKSISQDTEKHINAVIIKSCQNCGRAFENIQLLSNHEKKYPELYICDMCKRTFGTLKFLKFHQHFEHKKALVDQAKFCYNKKQKIYKCRICTKILPTELSLRYHMYIHISARPYKCSICQVSFKKYFHLKMHMNIHTQNKLCNKCVICNIFFTHKSSLRKHKKRYHNGRIPFFCSICHRSFHTVNAMKKHLQSHFKKPMNLSSRLVKAYA